MRLIMGISEKFIFLQIEYNVFMSLNEYQSTSYKTKFMKQQIMYFFSHSGEEFNGLPENVSIL